LRNGHFVIVYRIGESGQVLEFTETVLERFRSYRQTRIWHREAGGQLFADIEPDRVRVVEATGPRLTDRRTRNRYEPDRRVEQREIDDRFPKGLHFIGDWHSHPEDYPNPSTTDFQSTADSVRRSFHQLNAFVMVIVGRRCFPEALYVSLNDGTNAYVLRPKTD
jgi:integrative and conjugative element protein (TIGR02256 family)